MGKHIEVTVQVGKPRPRQTESEQLSLFELIAPKRVIKRKLTVYRPTQRLAARYHGLADIPPDEWFDFFPNTGEEWTEEDREYLLAWWGKDDVMSLAYALGRPPWGLQREICRLRKDGVEIAYLRHDE